MKESPARLSWIVQGTVLLFACGLAYEPLYHIIRGSLAYSIIPQDDFYYYYLTAKHFAATGFSSFDGIVPTNGYHPLWMLVLAGLSFLAHGNDGMTFIFMEVIQVFSAVATASLTLRLFRKLYGEQPWVPVISLFVALLLTVLIFLSMETVVVIPLFLFFSLMVARILENTSSARDALYCGLVGTLTVFARLDTLIAVGIVFLLLFFYRSERKKMIAFLAGLSPVAAYFILNKLLFGGWFPVSAQVKELASGLHFSLLPIGVILTPRGSIYFLLTVIGFVLALRGVRRSDPRSGIRFFIFAFPLLFALVLALRLSWSVYVWYFYPFPISAGAALFEIRQRLHVKAEALIDRIAIPGLVVILAVSGSILYHDIPALTKHLNLIESQTHAQPNIYAHALGIKPFTDTHPGRYAMGDRAGLTAFLTRRPMLQLEGLAADQALVDSIRAQADLLTVLKKYGVQYYIVSYPLNEFHEHDGHWELLEPHKQQALPWMPMMHARFYAPEVFRFPLPIGTPVATQDSSTWVTRILDISQSHQDSLETK